MTTCPRMTLLLASSLFIITGGMREAGAQPSMAEPIPKPDEPSADAPAMRVQREYYGWQILIADAASVAAGIAVARHDDTHAGMTVFASGYLLGGPIVHVSHGHPGRAVVSGLLRAGLPALGVYLWSRPEEECHDSPESEGSCGTGWVLDTAFIGASLAVLGMGIASAIDWSVLSASIEHVPVESGPMVVPQVSAGADGTLQIGVMGRF